MRNVPLETFKPKADNHYFVQVVASPDAKAVGIVVVGVGTGLAPCRGRDIDELDGYEGDVLHDNSGAPLRGVAVQYFRNGAFVHEVRTDASGHHLCLLPPGDYSYRYIMADGLAIHDLATGQALENGVTVLPGYHANWEVDAGDNIEQREQEIAYVTEELICDWNEDDGMAWAWPDVQSTIADIARIIRAAPKCKLRKVHVTGAQYWPRPDLILALKGRGVPVNEYKVTDAQLATCYRNLIGLIQSKYVGLLSHDRANFQLVKSVEWHDRRVEAAAGMTKYLADARVLAVASAAVAGSKMSSGGAFAYNPAHHGTGGTSLARIGRNGQVTPPIVGRLRDQKPLNFKG